MVIKKYKISFKGKNLRPILLLGIMEPLYFYAESQGILYTNATYSGIVLSVVPVVSIALAAVFLKEYPTSRQAVFSLLPVAGVVISAVSGCSLGIVTPLGAFFLTVTCLSSAAYKIFNRKAAEEFSVFERTYAVIFICSLIYTISGLHSLNWSFKEYIAPVFNPYFILPVLVLSIFCSVICNLLVNYAAGKLSVAKFSAFGTLTTLFSMFSGVLFLGEPFTAVCLLVQS
ncbi:hypothetical protein IMSAG049_00423 [Clostridiales bacterium]|nr:hypothetical protein IMSAG049_00423 [Clostridiales bacterium]